MRHWLSRLGIRSALVRCTALGVSTLALGCPGGGGGEDTPAGPAVTLAATTVAIAPGESTTLSLDVSGAVSCSTPEFALPANPNGSFVAIVSPATTTMYTVSCTDAGGAQTVRHFEVRVVLPPSVALSVSPISLRAGERAVVVTTVSGATRCAPSGFPGWTPRTSGSWTQSVVIVEDTTFELTCENADGMVVTRTFDVTITPKPTITLAFDRNPIPVGGTSMLTATYQNGFGCEGLGFPLINGSTAFRPGTFAITAFEDRSFVLFCSGPGGVSPALVTLRMEIDIRSAEVRPTANAGEIRFDWLINKPEDVESLAFEIDPTGVAGFSAFDLDGDGSIDTDDELLPSIAGITINPPGPIDLNQARFRILALDETGATLAWRTFQIVAAAPTPSDPGYIKATDPVALDRFGQTVALSRDGRTLAIGAPDRDLPGAAFGTGDHRIGAIYVYHLTDAGEWQRQALLKPRYPYGQGRSFGAQIALSADGSTLAVGQPRDELPLIDDEENFLGGRMRTGAVLIFERDDRGRWIDVARLKPPNPDNGDKFGISLDLSSDGTVLAIGASEEDSSATGVNPPSGIFQGVPIGQLDDSAVDTGAVYVYRRVGGEWTFASYIKSMVFDQLGHFGEYLSLSGDGRRLAIFSDADGESGPDGEPPATQSDLFSSGALWLFGGGPTNWIFEGFVQPAARGRRDEFGRAVDLDETGEVLIVGAAGEDSGVGGLNGDPDDDSAFSSGAAYVFRREASGWAQSEFIKSADPQPGEAGYLGAIIAERVGTTGAR